MIELIFAFVLFFMVISTYMGYPFFRHFRNYQQERAMLEKKYNKLWKCRRDLLVRLHLINSYVCCLESFRLGDFKRGSAEGNRDDGKGGGEDGQRHGRDPC